MADEKFKCTCCGKPKSLSKDFYISHNPIHSDINKLNICKDCLFKLATKNMINDEYDMNQVKDTLRRIDRPFLIDYWNSAIDESKDTNKAIFNLYMKNLSMPQNRDKTWNDSDSIDISDVQSVSYRHDNDFDYSDQWRGYTKEEALFLEGYYQDLIAVYEHKTPVQKNLYRNMAITQLQANKAISAGKMNDYSKLMKTLSDMMTDAKIKPLQDNGEEDGGLSTWGQWVKKIEETEPIPEPSEKFKDVDGIKKYIDKWFVGHLSKVFGINNNFDDELDDN